MNVIRDGSGFSPHMMALCINWGIRRCNVKGCTDVPNTIIGNAGNNVPVFGLCETHFQEGNQPNKPVTLNLEFDDYDAFTRKDE
jgi:hypothetical protein